MATNAKTLEAGSYAAMYPALGERNTLLALVGYYASLTGLKAQAAINGAKAAGYAALSEADLMKCFLGFLNGTTPVFVTPVLTFNAGVPSLNWTSTFTPTFWQTWTRNGGSQGAYTLDSQFPGSVTVELAPTFGSNYYVVGVGADGVTPQTNKSNVVNT